MLTQPRRAQAPTRTAHGEERKDTPPTNAQRSPDSTSALLHVASTDATVVSNSTHVMTPFWSLKSASSMASLSFSCRGGAADVCAQKEGGGRRTRGRVSEAAQNLRRVPTTDAHAGHPQAPHTSLRMDAARPLAVVSGTTFTMHWEPSRRCTGTGAPVLSTGAREPSPRHSIAACGAAGRNRAATPPPQEKSWASKGSACGPTPPEGAGPHREGNGHAATRCNAHHDS
jgi:hypothetical protein